MSRAETSGTGPELLNSSFYSSSSISSIDHVRNFRNSLILREFSDQDINETISPNKTDISSSQKSMTTASTVPSQKSAQLDKEGETQTINMSTSPSLSALAGILNKKSKQAERKMKRSSILQQQITEAISEDEDNVDEQSKKDDFDVGQENTDIYDASIPEYSSPNLIDFDGTHNVQIPTNIPKTDYIQPEEPDFLSSPRKPALPDQAEQSSLEADAAKVPVKEDSRIETSASNTRLKNTQFDLQRHAPIRSLVPPKLDPPAPIKPKKRKHEKRPSRKDAPAPEPINNTTSKKKGLFSFLKMKNNKNRQTSTSSSSSKGLQTSRTFSVDYNKHSDIPAAEKLSKKSHSSSSLFTALRKNKDEESITSKKHVASRQKSSNQTHKTKKYTELASDVKNSHDKKKVSDRKPTPLNFELELEAKESLRLHKDLNGTDTSELVKPNPAFVGQPKFDTGVSLFPKSLDAQEVESIVSLERNRSIKSNTRNSVSSYNKSKRDSLSANAQHEGMFISEATSVILSTPDLTKSPASSILRNGKFETNEIDLNVRTLDNERPKSSSAESLDLAPVNLTASSVHDFSLDSIAEQFNTLKIEYEHTEEDEKGHADEENELISDIMEFANIINFGDGIDLDLDLPFKETTKSSPEMRVNSTSALSRSPLQNKPVVETTAKVVTSVYGDGDVEYVEQPNVTEDTSFENENFNELEETSLPIGSQYRGLSRPISMSFKGSAKTGSALGADTNASILYNRDTEEVLNTESFHLDGTKTHFSSEILLYDTYGEDEYDRRPDIATCNQLTPQLAQMIKVELNELKGEMEVHEDSRCYTHFY